jgi:hypothetical protein
MRLGRWISIGLLLTAALAVPRSASGSPSAKLVYVRAAGAETCPAEGELRKAVAVRIGYDPFFPFAQKTVVAQVMRAPNGYRGTVQIVASDGLLRGERELSTTGDDCSELVGALALAVSIALDDLDESPPAEAEPEPPPPRERARSPDETEQAPIVPLPKAPPAPVEKAVRPDLAVSLGPVLSLGTAPAPVAGASLAAAIGWTSFAVRLDVRAELPASKPIPASGSVATNTLLTMASACLRARVPFGCVGTGMGALFSSTESIAQTRRDRGLLFVAMVRGGINLPIVDWLYIEPAVEGGLNLLTHEVMVDGTGVHRLSPVWASVALHLGGKFEL